LALEWQSYRRLSDARAVLLLSTLSVHLKKSKVKQA